MAYGMRAEVRMMPLLAPSAEMRIAAATSPAPRGPSVRCTASDATSVELAMWLGDRTYEYAMLASTYSAITMSVDRMMDRGRFRPGSLISLPTYVVSIHPSYAHSTATIATPKGPMSWCQGVPGQRGLRFSSDPPGKANAVMMS